MKYVTFKVGKDDFGIPVDQVKEVVPAHFMQEMPGVEKEWLGVITLHQHSLAVFNLHKILGFAPKISPYIMVVTLKPQLLGLPIDGILGVLEINDHQVDLTEKMLGISGVARMEGKTLFLLNLASLLGEKVAS
ncbi:MAG: chemotaxis protein CheW [Deltaproteobacteria bacterium]|nr:chemotaxis protein CheW [Deltaproteobacteria bacterium]